MRRCRDVWVPYQPVLVCSMTAVVCLGVYTCVLWLDCGMAGTWAVTTEKSAFIGLIPAVVNAFTSWFMFM